MVRISLPAFERQSWMTDNHFLDFGRDRSMVHLCIWTWLIDSTIIWTLLRF